MVRNRWNLPNLGFGVGLRTVHYDYIISNNPPVDWFEIISENFLDTKGRSLYILKKIAEKYRIVTHGVSMSIGSTDDLNIEYLQKLKTLADTLDTPWITDHLCWTGVNAHNIHDLLPLSYNKESLDHIVDRIKKAQDIVQRPLAFENVSAYIEFSNSTMTEWDFIAEMSEKADCGILLDVNNIYVSSYNHGFDPYEFIDAIPADRICQYHLAGHTNKGTHILDTHSDHVVDAVWELYRYAVNKSGPRSTLLEWDDNIPDFDTVHQEVLKAKQHIGTNVLIEKSSEHQPEKDTMYA